jgi:hypothetical protein
MMSQMIEKYNFFNLPETIFFQTTYSRLTVKNELKVKAKASLT